MICIPFRGLTQNQTEKQDNTVSRFPPKQSEVSAPSQNHSHHSLSQQRSRSITTSSSAVQHQEADIQEVAVVKQEQGMKEDYLDPGDGAGEMVQYEGDGDGGAYDNYYEDPSAAVMEFDNSANILNSKGENYRFFIYQCTSGILNEDVESQCTLMSEEAP